MTVLCALMLAALQEQQPVRPLTADETALISICRSELNETRVTMSTPGSDGAKAQFHDEGSTAVLLLAVLQVIECDSRRPDLRRDDGWNALVSRAKELLPELATNAEEAARKTLARAKSALDWEESAPAREKSPRNPHAHYHLLYAISYLLACSEKLPDRLGEHSEQLRACTEQLTKNEKFGRDASVLGCAKIILTDTLAPEASPADAATLLELDAKYAWHYDGGGPERPADDYRAARHGFRYLRNHFRSRTGQVQRWRQENPEVKGLDFSEILGNWKNKREADKTDENDGGHIFYCLMAAPYCTELLVTRSAGVRAGEAGQAAAVLRRYAARWSDMDAKSRSKYQSYSNALVGFLLSSVCHLLVSESPQLDASADLESQTVAFSPRTYNDQQKSVVRESVALEIAPLFGRSIEDLGANPLVFRVSDPQGGLLFEGGSSFVLNAAGLPLGIPEKGERSATCRIAARLVLASDEESEAGRQITPWSILSPVIERADEDGPR